MARETTLSPSAEMLSKINTAGQLSAVNCKHLCQLALQNKKESCLISRKCTWQLSDINLFITPPHSPKQVKWPQMAATFHSYGRLLHHTQYARSRWCTVQCTPLHCNNSEVTMDLMTVGLHCTISVFKMSKPMAFQKL